MSNVTIYSTRSCPYCKMAKDFFNENSIEFRDIDVTDDTEAQEEMIEKSNQMAVPVIEVDNDIVVGFDQARLKELLEIS